MKKRLFLFVLFGFLFASTSHAKPLIIIDPGHQPSDPGAYGSCRKKEVDYNDELARFLLKELVPSYQVFLTRIPGKEMDTSDSLRDYVLTARDKKLWQKNKKLLARPAMANLNNAQIFISLHHDSVVSKNKKKDPNLCDHRGGKTLTAAFKKKFKIGFNVFIYDMNHDQRSHDSLRLADDIGAQLVGMGRVASNYHHTDCKTCQSLNKDLGVWESNFAVLRNTKMPAVLIEVGNIADADDEAKVNNDEFRKKFALAMKKAIDRYFRASALKPVIPSGVVGTPAASS